MNTTKKRLPKNQIRFRTSSLRERFYLLKNPLPEVTDVTYTSIDGNDAYDSQFTSAGTYTCLLEIKVRDQPSTAYPAGVVIEKDKLDRIVQNATNTNTIPMYGSYWTDGVFTLHNLLEFTGATVTTQKYKKTTMGNTELVDKEIINLPHNQCMRFNYNIPDKDALAEKINSLIQERYEII